MTLLQRNFVTAKPINFYYLVCKLDRVQYPAYGFRNFFNFRIRILLALPNTYIAINWRNKQTAHAKVQAQAA